MPALPDIWSSFTHITEYITGGGKRGSASEVVEETPEDARGPPRLPDRMHGEDAKDEGSKKRPITVDSQDSLPRKRADRRSADEKRLAGDYTTPSTAVRIQPYGNTDWDDSDNPSKLNTTMHKPGSGRRHKFGSTLNQASPHVAGARKLLHASFMNDNKGIRKPSFTEQPTVLPQARSRHGDGFDDHELARDAYLGRRPAKKPRLEMKPSLVDMTTDDEDLNARVVVGVNHKGLPGNMKASQAHHISNREPTYFKSTEFENVDSMASYQPSKKKRKSKDGRASSQASSREVPVDASNGHADVSEHSVVEVFKQEVADSHGLDKPNSMRPPINLEKGFNEIDPSFTHTSTNDKDVKIGNAEDVSGKVTYTRGRAGQLRKPNTEHRQTALRPAASMQSIPPFGSRNLRDDGSSNLRDEFRRDTRPPVQQRAPERMKATSHSAGVRVSNASNDSDDVLSGEPTIGSRASGSVSPLKSTQIRVPKPTGVTHRRKSISPGRLAPTQFRSSGRLSQTADKRAGNTAEPKKTYEDTKKVPIRAFYATSFILESGDLMLQYDEHEKQFDLYCEGHIQVLPRKKKAVSFGASEAHKIFFASNSHYVYLRGSNRIDNSSVSNGHICIAFSDPDGVKWFLDSLLVATEDLLNIQAVTQQRLHDIFQRQVKDIQERNATQRVLFARAENDAVTRTKGGDGLDEESVRYEDDSTMHSGSEPLLQKSHLFNGPHETPQQRRSSRQTRKSKHLSPNPEPLRKWSQINKPQRWDHSVVYPPEGQRRVTVDFQDLERLDEGEFLNDNIISFALRRIEENMSSEHKDDVFFFNSFFYTALTSKNGHRSFNYDAVKRWTKNKDLFTLPYVVVPININLHWFVTIICNLPSVSHKATGLEDENEEDQMHDREAQNNSSSVVAVDAGAFGVLAENEGATSHPERMPSSRTRDGEAGEEVQAQTTAMRHLSISQGEEETNMKSATGAEEDQTLDDPEVEVIATSHGKLAGTTKSKKRAPPPPKKYNPDRPTIITLDSFGSSHAAETRNLKDYLKAEAEAKRSMELDTKELQGMTAKGIPEQTNFCDCGLYLVGYVEEFAKNPRQFVTKVLTRQLDKQADFASFDPSAKRDEIRNELLKLYEEQETSRKTKKSTKKATAKDIISAMASSPTPAMAKNAEQDSEAPTANGSAEGTSINVSKQQKQPVIPASDPQMQASTAAEEEQLSQEVPRALSDPAVRKIETASQSPEYPIRSHEYDAMTTHGEDVEYSSAANAQDIAGTLADDSDAMLDFPDVPMGETPGILSNATDRGHSSDLLGPLEQALPTSDAELKKDTFRPNAEDAPRVNGRIPRERKRHVSPIVLIDDDVVDAQLEVPESPVEQQRAPQPQIRGRHTKFD